MSEPLHVFDINDRETGKVYRIRSDAKDATREEAIEYVSSLPEEERSQFEYTPQESAPEVVETPAPVSVSAEDTIKGKVAEPGKPFVRVPLNNQSSEPKAAEEGKPFVRVPLHGEPAVRVDLDRPDTPEARTQTVAEGALIQKDAVNPLRVDAAKQTDILAQMIKDKKYSEEDIRSFAEGTGLTFEGLDENLKARAEGKAVTDEIGLDPEWDKMFAQIEDPGLEQGDRTGLDRLGDAYKEATQYGFPGLVARKVHDWMDSGKDDIRKLFPGRDEEWYEQMQEFAVSQTQRKLREEAALRQEQDPNWRPDESFFNNLLASERWAPWFLGQIGGSAGPEMAFAPGATLAARATAQGVLGGVSDLGYQVADVADDVADDIDPMSLAANVAFGVGGEAAMTGVARAFRHDSARGRGKDSSEIRVKRVPKPLEPLDQLIPTRTTHDRRTASYQRETRDANYAIADRVNYITQDWKNAPVVDVMDDFSGVRGLDNDALGVYRSDGTVMLNTDAILKYAEANRVSPDDVVQSVMFHEGLGHHGLASKYGADLENVMLDFYIRGDADYKARVDAWMERTGVANPTLASEEVLAEMSEQGVMPVAMLDRLTSLFREYARRIGINLKYTDNEIRTLLGVAQRETTEGASQWGGGLSDKYKTVYHGSPHDFAPTANNPLGEFDHSRMGSGEGAQYFGWGTYLTDVKRVAETRYRDSLSDSITTVRGVPMETWKARETIQSLADQQGIDEVIISDFFLKRTNDKTPIDQTDIDTLVDYVWGDQAGPSQIAQVKAGADLVNEVLDIKTTGKLYEVDIPDDAKFLEWEDSISSQPHVVEGLEEQGFEVVDYDYFLQVQSKAYEKRAKYENLNRRIETLDHHISEAETTGHLDLGNGEVVPVSREEIAQWNEEADELFPQLQMAAIERNRALDLAKKYLHEDMDGASVYNALVEARGGPKEASLLLKDSGIQGNRYLVDNLRKGTSRKNDGTDQFNYVMFDEADAKITNKYMKPRKGDYMRVGVKGANDNVTPYTKDARGRPRLPGRVMSHSEYASYAEDMVSYYKGQADKWINRDEVLFNKRLKSAREWQAIAEESRAKSDANRFNDQEPRSVRPITKETVIDTHNSIDSEYMDTASNDKYMKPRDEVGYQRVKDKLSERRTTISEMFDDVESVRISINSHRGVDLDEDSNGLIRLEEITDYVDQLHERYEQTFAEYDMSQADARIVDEMHKIYDEATKLHNEASVVYNAGLQKQGDNDNPANPFRDTPRVGKNVKGLSQSDAAEAAEAFRMGEIDILETALSSSNDKYMRPKKMDDPTPVNPEDLSPDELFDSLNAYDILDGIIPKDSNPVMSMEQLQAEAVARKVPPSALLKLVEKEPGYLARKLFMHDTALVKAGERVAELSSRINSGNYTVQDKVNFIKTMLSYEELTSRIFGMGSEFGLALRAMQEVTYTKKKISAIRDALGDLGNGMEALDDPATFEKFAREMSLMLEEATTNVKKGNNPFLSALNLPRALMSSMDLSAPLRQGLFFIGDRAYWRAAADMHKMFVSDKEFYDSVMSEIASRPNHKAMVEAKVAFSSVESDAPLTARDEDFQTSMADSVPGVARSNRAFSGFRNKLSADMFDKYYDLAQKAGADVSDPEVLKKIGALVNAGTGRGNIPQFLLSAAPLLNGLFFSPRLMASRLALLNPAMYYRLPPGVRKAAVLRAASVGSSYVMFLSALNHFAPDVEVESDPRSTDFGKVRIGNTRLDVLGGFGQYITLGARLATGQKLSSAGRVYELGSAPFIQSIHKGLRGLLVDAGLGDEASYASDPSNPAFADDTRSIIGDFLENKLAPNTSYVNDMLHGKNFAGEPFDPVDEALARTMPMYFQDMAELHSEEGPGLFGKTVGTIGGMYGVGVNTYISRSLDPKQELKAPEAFTDKDVADGENEYVIAKGGRIVLKPEAREMWEDRINLYFTQIMDFEMQQDGWDDLEDRSRADIIAKARTEARREAKKDMVISLGVE